MINSITASPNPVELGGVVNLICDANDDDESNILRDESLTYTWFTAYGEIISREEVYTAIWTAPADSGIFSISCTVKDQSNGLDIATIDITVE